MSKRKRPKQPAFDPDSRELGIFITEASDGFRITYTIREGDVISRYTPKQGEGPHPKARAVATLEEFRRVASQWLLRRLDVVSLKESPNA